MATKQQALAFRTNVIQPALQSIKSWSPAAEELLLGTALVESNLIHRVQIGGGPARGLFQMEPATHNDIWDNFLKYKPELSTAITHLLTTPNADKIAELQHNDKYACAMARVHYQRVPAALPSAGDIQGMANYWKQYYNTVFGAGTPSKFVQKWTSVMG